MNFAACLLASARPVLVNKLLLFLPTYYFQIKFYPIHKEAKEESFSGSVGEIRNAAEEVSNRIGGLLTAHHAGNLLHHSLEQVTKHGIS